MLPRAIPRQTGFLRPLPKVTACINGDLAIEAAEAAAIRVGIDMSAHRATARESFTMQARDLVIVMEPEQAKRLVDDFPDGVQCSLLGLWSRPCRPHVEDPYGLPDIYFDTYFALISSAVASFSIHIKEHFFAKLD